MDIPEATRQAEEELLDAARHPGKQRLNRALRRPRGQQFVAVMTVAAAGMPGTASAAGVPASASYSAVAAETVASGTSPASTIVLTAHQQPAARQSAGITDGQWRAALIASAQHEMARNPSRAGAWAQAGESDNGPQCAEGQSVIVRGAESAIGVQWVANPNVTSAYHESQTWVIWRVSGDGSWQQWAQAHGRWHPAGDGYTPQAGDLGIYGDPGYHIVMMGGDGTVYGMDDSSDLGNHHRPAGGGFSGYIDMSLPSSLAASGHQSNSGNGNSARQPRASAPAQSTPQQQADQPVVGLAAPGFGPGSQDGGTSLSSSATPVTAAVVAGGVAAPAFVAGTVGHTDEFHADQPKRPSQPKRPRYARHNPPPQVQASVPGSSGQQAFINMVAPGAIAAQARYGVPAAVTIAQAIIESGWGQSGLAARDHNLFGIKGSGPAGTDNLPTQEYQGGSWVTITAPFRVYHNVAESISDHGALLHNGYYNAALAAWANHHDANGFANALTGVYATDPQYGQTLITTMQRFNLYQFNHMTASSGQQATSASAGRAPVNRNAKPRTVPGARLGNTGQPPADQGQTPGQVPVPTMSPDGVTPVVAAPGSAGSAGNVAAPGFAGGAPTLSAASSGSAPPDNGIKLAADVTSTAPWWDSGSSGASQNPMPWMDTPKAHPVPRDAPMPWHHHSPVAPPPATRRPPRGAPQRAELAAYRRPPNQTGSATSLQLVDYVPLDIRHGQAFLKGFKHAVAARRDEFRHVSQATGVPWQLVGALALLGRPKGADIFTLQQLVEWFAQQAWAVARVDVTGEMSPAQIEAAFSAYTGRAKIKERGLNHATLALLIRVPPGTHSV